MQDIKASLVWFLLVVVTLSMYLLSSHQYSQQMLAALMLLAAWFKGQLIIDYFMGLRRVALRWRLIVSLWLVIVLGCIYLIYQLTLV